MKNVGASGYINNSCVDSPIKTFFLINNLSTYSLQSNLSTNRYFDKRSGGGCRISIGAGLRCSIIGTYEPVKMKVV